MQIVEVTWLDAGCEHEDLDIERAKEINPMPRRNVGYLVEDNEDKLVVCFGIIEDKDKKNSCTSDTLVIPKSIVLNIKPLETNWVVETLYAGTNN